MVQRNALDKSIHRQKSAHYKTSTFDFTHGLSVRDCLAGQSYEFQYNFGMDILKKFGGL